MADTVGFNPFSSFPDLETEYPSSSYTPLPNQDEIPETKNKHNKGFLLTLCLFTFLALVMVMSGQYKSSKTHILLADDSRSSPSASPEKIRAFTSRGVSEGVSEKAVWPGSGDEESFPWTSSILSWQKTAYHFQPEENWINDPDGPMFYSGWYHLFYQYNPYSAVWGNISWGHAVSKDLIHWLYLPLAMVPDHWYEANGVWTGSATLLADGTVVMVYTSSTDELVQVQNVAFPANLSDPLLLDWVKYSDNPVLVPPPGIGAKDFRDPTTAFFVSGKWRIVIGTKINTTGIALVYETTDFLDYKLMDGLLHEVPTTGMWECVDFYPVSTTGMNGLDTSVNGLGIKHVLKVSLDDNKKDFYALGTYDPVNNTWTPDDPELDVGIGIRYDYGKFYASKTFYDQNKKRRVLWGWVGETDRDYADKQKGWSGLQAIPRVVTFDMKTKTNIIQWPVEEVESLRVNSTEFKKVKVEPGSIVPLDVGSASQLDISAEIEIDVAALERNIEADVLYNCSSSNGAAGRGALGPFGLLVFTDESFSEQTAVYFYIAKGTDGNVKTFFCTDQSRSSEANDVDKKIYGGFVPVLDGEKFSMRLLVDHSIIEAFAQGGRTCITSRVYPTKAIYGAARLFLFNNATDANVTVTSLKTWRMNSAFLHPYPL